MWARDVRFGLVAVVRCEKHVVNVYDDHSDVQNSHAGRRRQGPV